MDSVKQSSDFEGANLRLLSEMSVLNQSGEEQVECPLCMEPLEVDDLNFFPCTCGYQICRFCWHRIRTDENGLCPACRKAYSEDPADFIPLSKEQVAQLKAEKRQRDQQRKAKLSESRKHLASVRVVQRNLVFVVGLPMRLADPEILKKYEYFGKFGKIHKVVINQSTSYAGTQGPSASAYVTYMKSDDALRAIQNVNNTIMDGKTIKTSLGTTKYCSHFMKNQPCPKPDCMYLHDLGDQEASFTKEQMHAGKHQEYEKKLHEALLSRLAAQTSMGSSNGGNSNGCVALEPQQKAQSKQKETPSGGATTAPNQQSTNKENWPQLNPNEKVEKKDKEKAEKDKKGKKAGKSNGGGGDKKSNSSSSATVGPNDKKTPPPVIENINININCNPKEESILEEKVMLKLEDCSLPENSIKMPVLDDNSSFFSQNSFTKIPPENGDSETDPSLLLQQHSEPLLEMNDTDSWEFDFGYTKHSNHLEELAKLRTDVKDTLESFGNNFGLESYSKLESSPSPFGQMDSYNTENLLETLAKNSVNYAQNMQPPPNGHYNVANGHKDMNGMGSMNNLDQHMSKFFTDFYRNGFSQQPQPQTVNPNLHLRDGLSLGHVREGHNGGLSPSMNLNMNGLSQPNGFHPHHPPMNMAEKHTFALIQQQRHIEEQLMNLTFGNKQQQPPQMPQMNGQYDVGPCQNGAGPFGSPLNSLQNFGNSAISSSSAPKSRPIPEEKELDYRFQEAQKALEELVESDSHMHNSGRTNIGSSQINGIVNSQCGNYMLPPPPGFVQPTTHMNSFGSKILPYLNMNSQQQQINTTQNSWPSNFSQNQQQHKNMGMGNDWKLLDPAILSSRRHIPNMPPLVDPYAPLAQLGTQSQSQPPQNGPQRSFDTYNGSGGGFSNFSPLQQNYNNYSHLTTQQNLNWLSNEINTQISSPPGFRTSGQATKQQEC